MDSIRVIYMTVHVIVALFGCCINASLIYLARFHSPGKIKTYATLIMNFAFTDFLSCVADIFTLQRAIPIDRTAVIFLSSGPCQFISRTACFIAYNFMLHLLIHSLLSLLLSFSYRYYVLFKPSPRKRTVLGILALMYIPSFTHLIISSTTQGGVQEIQDILFSRFPNFDTGCQMVSGVTDMASFASTFHVAGVSLPIFPIYTAILIIRHKIITSLGLFSASMSNDTKSMHKQLLKALTYQSMIPGFFVIGVVSFTLEQFNLVSHPILGYTTVTALILISVLTPMASLVFVKPYRERIRIFVGLKSSTVERFSVVFVTTTA
ncbi:unnamed protein product [Caenorhabditis auriculariae]|uniref:G protein-coupled receptor n=1 Tax=Caenorhabditis auriculariae TaxID=2777116 RepID=A0A8S1HPB6_9PELO|nr:unnamed protein product [Caenorhabditis auriculariae]